MDIGRKLAKRILASAAHYRRNGWLLPVIRHGTRSRPEVPEKDAPRGMSPCNYTRVPSKTGRRALSSFAR